MNNQKKSVTDAVMQKIKRGDVRMKSRLYFTLLSIASILAIGVSGILVSYLSTMLFYWIRIETASTMAYGARRNLSDALATFPWWAVVVAIGLMLLAILLAKKHGTMYRHKTSTVALIIVALSLVVGFVMYSAGVGISPHDNQGAGRRGQGLHQNR